MGASRTEQVGFRGRDDDVSLNSTTFTWANNTNWTQDVDVNFRVRLEVEEDGGKNEVVSGQLEARHYTSSWGSWFNVTASSTIVKGVSSSNFTDGEQCSDILTNSAQTWVTGGDGSHDGSGTNLGLDTEHSEWEYCLQIISGDVSDGDLVELRMAGIDVWTVTPQIEVNKLPIVYGTASISPALAVSASAYEILYNAVALGLVSALSAEGGVVSEGVVVVNLGDSGDPDINSGTDTTTYTSTSWTPSTSDADFYVLDVCWQNNTAYTTPGVSGPTGLTWTNLVVFNPNSYHGMGRWVAQAGASAESGTTTITFDAAQLSCTAVFCKVEGSDTSSGYTSAFPYSYTNSTSSDTTLSVSLSEPTNSGCRPLAVTWVDINESQTDRANWTTLDTIIGAGRARSILSQWRQDQFETTASSSWTTSSPAGIIATELAYPGAGLVTGSINLSLASALTAAALVQRYAAAAVALAGDVSAAGYRQIPGAAGISLSSSVSSAATVFSVIDAACAISPVLASSISALRQIYGAIDLQATGAVSAASMMELYAAAAVNSALSVTVAGDVIGAVLASINLALTGQISVTALRQIFAAADLALSGTTSVESYIITPADVNLVLTSALSATSLREIPSGVDLSLTSELLAAAYRQIPASVNLALLSTVSVTGSVVSGVIEGLVDLALAGDVSAQAFLQRFGVVDLQLASSVSAETLLLKIASVDITLASSLVAEALRMVLGEANVTLDTSLASQGYIIVQALADISLSGQVIPAGSLIIMAMADIVAAMGVSIDTTIGDQPGTAIAQVLQLMRALGVVFEEDTATGEVIGP